VSVRFVGVDGADIPAVNPGFVPRNAWVELTFEAPIDPATVGEPFMRIRRGPYFQEPSFGQFQVDGARVLFNPTAYATGTPRPYGFDALTEHEIRIPAGVPTGEMVRNRAGLPILTTFVFRFTTTDAWIVESDPPRLLGYTFLPGSRDDGTVNAQAALQLDFSEPISPDALRTAIGPLGAAPADAFDVRYVAADPVNVAGGVAGSPIVMRAFLVGNGRSVRLEPVYGYGDRRYAFEVRVLPGLRDLGGNGVTPAVDVGRFVCAGDGGAVPSILGEGFDTQTDADPAPVVQSADRTATWAAGSLVAQPVSIRRAYVQSARRAISDNGEGKPGTIAIYPAPLIGKALNAVAPGTYPPTAAGRRVLLSFSPAEIGGSGTVLGAGWGPNLNATYAAKHADVVIRMGYGSMTAVNIGPTIAGSYESTPVITYRGPYSVAQRANVGNETPTLVNSTGVAADQPLYDYTGFVEWPAFTQTFEWDATRNRPLLLDVSATEGETWQDFRGYFPGPLVGPANADWPAPRRLTATYESDSYAYTPDPSVMDTVFTIGKHRSVAQSRFYTPPATDAAGNAYPAPLSVAHTFGVKSDYSAAVALGTVPTGTQVRVEYQAAMALDPSSGRTAPDLTKATTPWTTRVDDCDGYPYLRWRVTLVGDYATMAVPTLDSIVIQVAKMP